MTSSSFDANSSSNYFDAIANLDMVVETTRGPAVLLSCVTPFTLIWLQTIAAGNALSLGSGFQGVCTGQQLPTPKPNLWRRTRNCDPCGTCSEGKVKCERFPGRPDMCLRCHNKGLHKCPPHKPWKKKPLRIRRRAPTPSDFEHGPGSSPRA